MAGRLNWVVICSAQVPFSSLQVQHYIEHVQCLHEQVCRCGCLTRRICFEAGRLCVVPVPDPLHAEDLLGQLKDAGWGHLLCRIDGWGFQETSTAKFLSAGIPSVLWRRKHTGLLLLTEGTLFKHATVMDLH